jgi:hypothetical protein
MRFLGLAAAVASAALLAASCVAPPDAVDKEGSARDAEVLAAQSLVMEMADEYVAALGEAVYLDLRGQSPLSGTPRRESPQARVLSQSFLRNGVGAAIDIAAGPNPSVAILDLLVLASLQRWAFRAHWMPEGISDAGDAVYDRLGRAEDELWRTASRRLSQDQLATVRRLIGEWIADHPDRTVVSLVRFADFADERMAARTASRREAGGLLREVSAATGAIDDARLLGERALWFASRYPYVLGEQTELTAYRLAAQPEVQESMRAMEAIRGAAESAGTRLDALGQELRTELDAIVARIATERETTIRQAQVALAETVEQALDIAAARLASERETALAEFFRGVAVERDGLLEAIDRRQGDLQGSLADVRTTIAAAGELAEELTRTAASVDRIVARFDPEARPRGQALQLEELRALAVEAATAADRLSDLLERTDTLLASPDTQDRLAALVAPADGLVDRIFWRALALVGLLLVGLALLRLIPSRRAAAR